MKTFSCRFSLFVGLLWAGTLTAYDFEYDAGDIEGEKDSTGITYTLSVSKGDLGTSYDFDTKEGVTSGSPTGIDINVSSGGATGTKAYPNDFLPTANFTISMNGKLVPPSGGSGTQPTWGARGNAKAPFHIKSDQNGGEKDIVVPHGTSVKYSAYQGTSLQNSTWSVTGFPSKEAEEIRFNKSFWLSLWPWSAPNIINPEPGVYNISATSKDPAGGSDSAQMTVVGGEFKEHSSHAYGFDDYTNWNKNATDYYGTKTGKCTLPYASVRSGYQGRSNFTLTPSPISRDIEFSSSTDRLVFSPATTKSSRNVIFNASSGWFSSSATLSAKLDNTTFANLSVRSYNLKTITVGVRLVHETSYTSTDIPTASIQQTLSEVYKQACVNVTVTRLPTITINFDLNSDGKVDVGSWMTQEMTIIKNAGDAAGYDYIIFIVSNPNDGSLGYMNFSQKYGFVHGGGGQTVAHELGHGQGLRHIFELDATGGYNNAPAKGVDDNNLMHSYAGANRVKLRMSQWNNLNN